MFTLKIFNWELKIHSHQITVHFPTALYTTSALFLILYLLTHEPSFETALFYNLILATLACIPAFITGWIDWKTSFKGAWVRIFQHKYIGAIILFFLGLFTITLRIINPEIMLVDSSGKWLYAGLVLLLAAIVVYLGYLGGRLTGS